MGNAITQKIEQLITNKLSSLDIELVDIEYRKEGKDQMLRLFIDHEQGVDLQLCADVTRLVKNLIDENGINYDHFEVSSPGIDRVIKKENNPQRFIGERVRIKTYKEYMGSKKIVGILSDVNSETITLINDQESFEIPWDVVTTMRLYPDFD